MRVSTESAKNVVYLATRTGLDEMEVLEVSQYHCVNNNPNSLLTTMLLYLIAFFVVMNFENLMNRKVMDHGLNMH